MIMRVRQEQNVLVLELEGQLDFESTQEFRRACDDLLTKHDAERVVVDMERLRFVGSSGIGQFIRALKDLHKTRKTQAKLCHASSEFQRLFRVYQTARRPFEFYNDVTQAILSFESEPLKRPRRPRPIDN